MADGEPRIGVPDLRRAINHTGTIMSAKSWNETYSHSRKPRMRRRKREVGKTINTIDRRKAKEEWETDFETKKKPE